MIIKVRGREAYSLVEVVLSISLLTIVVLMALFSLMTLHRLSRYNSLMITARNCIREQAEEIMSVAADNSHYHEEAAQTVLAYYCGEFDKHSFTKVDGTVVNKVQTKGAGRYLEVYFSVPRPGWATRSSSARSSKKSADASPHGQGMMTIYLDETLVKPDKDVFWADLGSGSGRRHEGFDINGDGKISQREIGYALSVMAIQPWYTEVRHLPVDINVTYYRGTDITKPILSLTRRVIVSGLRDHSKVMDGSATELAGL